MVSPTRMRGSSDSAGSWNTSWMRPRISFERMSRPRPILLAVKSDLAGSRFNETHDRASDGRFAGAGFADQRQSFAGLDGEIDTVDRLHDFSRTGDRKLLLQILHLKQSAHAAAVSTGKWQRT